MENTGGVRVSKKQEQFVTLFTTSSNDLLKFCIAHGLTRHDADDIVSEVFTRLWIVWDDRYQFTHEINKGWIYRTAINVMHERFRQLKRNRTDELEAIKTIQGEDMINSREEDIVFEEHIKDILHGLSDDEKRIFDLFILQRYSYKEISSMLNVPSGTLRSQISRLRTRLKPLYEKLINHKI